MSATALKERLRADLKTAMQARANGELRVLRTLIAALDNAEAVPGENRCVPRAFGEPGAEVARRELDGEAIGGLLGSEIETRLSAAADYDRHGETAEAERLRREAALVERNRRAWRSSSPARNECKSRPAP